MALKVSKAYGWGGRREPVYVGILLWRIAQHR